MDELRKALEEYTRTLTGPHTIAEVAEDFIAANPELIAAVREELLLIGLGKEIERVFTRPRPAAEVFGLKAAA